MSTYLMDTPVELCQAPREFEPLLELYREARPKRVLEIGTAAGGTMYHWLQNAPAGALVVSVDLPIPEYPPPSRDDIESWCPPGVEGLLVMGNSHHEETLTVVEKMAPYHWLFIDAAHDYEAVRADWDMYMPLVGSGGYVVLHDISLVRAYDDGRPPAGVWRMWHQIRLASFWTREIRAHVDEYGIGVVRIP